jgi:hypothetical protein
MGRRLSLLVWLAALALPALSMTSAPARSEGVGTLSCYGSHRARSCVATFRRGRFHPHVIAVPAPLGDDLAAAEARDRRWVERCNPVIRQDRYGMPRYSYAAQGCEYGRVD